MPPLTKISNINTLCQPQEFEPSALFSAKGKVIFVGKETENIVLRLAQTDYLYFDTIALASSWLQRSDSQDSCQIAATVIDTNVSLESLNSFCADIRKSSKTKNAPILLATDKSNFPYQFYISSCTEVDDVICTDAALDDIIKRLNFLTEYRSRLSKKHLHNAFHVQHTDREQRQSYWVFKRLFDIFFALSAIILLSPLLLIIGLLILAESGWPFFYTSKRAGSDYQVFDFYKFRTMRSNADNLREEYKNINFYNSDLESPVFFKVKNDPRVTRIGKFLRKTSLDELPQLINILKGDMSIVGNRPLPLDEGANLTKDQWASRFLAPAGLTGLWQVSKSKKQDMTVSERIELDLYYAKHHSLWLDMKIIFKTFPAMLQKGEM
ncbi:sugar transferase [Tunicatimonas pelagia]|uniref:sugar transferase n=1 Tax=Tunicatimonas pelagia TaxID=931531 RepID=UPI002665F718|nr:sugar transferase [Tunicatimonas pelagia]WKN42325.1 sugar transferase [Tunicatimonas pelagia]